MFHEYSCQHVEALNVLAVAVLHCVEVS